MVKLQSLFRSLTKNKVTSIITITGFSVSISMVMIIIAFLSGEFSYDSQYAKIGRIFRVFADNNVASLREEFRDLFVEKYPLIEDACRYNNYNSVITRDNKPFNGQMIDTDSSYFNIFSTRFITGSANSSFINPNDVILTESFSRMIFGNEDPIGKTIVAECQTPLTVTGIVKDFSEYSSIRGDFFTNSKIKIKYESSNDGMGNEVNFFRIFILLKDSKGIPGLEKVMTDDLTSMEYKFGSVKKLELIPFSKSYFLQGIERSQTFHSNLKLIRLLTLITSIIILLAVFNYINLTTATYTDRHREIGIKKTVGATKGQIFFQFITESFFVCFISFLLALFLFSFWVPFFERFLGRRIDLANLIQARWFLMIVCGILVISFISGFYPALSISRLPPHSILSKNELKIKQPLGLRAILNIFQYSVSIILIAVLIVLTKQIDFVRTKDYGFNSDKLLRLDVHWRLADKTRVIKEELLSIPAITNVSFSHGSPGSIYLSFSWEPIGRDQTVSVLTTDSTFLNVFRIPVVQGRDLVPSDFGKVCYINETAYKMTGWDSFEGKKFFAYDIIGIVKDFNYSDLYNKIGPLIIPISSEMGVSNAAIRISPENISQTINKLKEIWNKVCPDYELRYQFYDQWLESMYKGEEKLASAIRLFAVLAVFISCSGILGLAEFSIKKRTKEIGIRKVNGAGVLEVLLLLNTGFLKWVLIAFILAVPVAWYVIRLWLDTFTYRTRLSPVIFIIAGLIAALTALLTVSWQSWRAAARNPVDALRYE